MYQSFYRFRRPYLKVLGETKFVCQFAAHSLVQRRVGSGSTRATTSASAGKEFLTSDQPPTEPESQNDNVPKALSRPIGLASPPMPGENTGLDPRDWRTRRDDFFDYDKHLERRRHLTNQVSKPYFRDWSNMRTQKGKVFMAPSKLLRADKALYFPNLWGCTLAIPKDERDTTPVLHGKLSVVAVFSGTWAEQQTRTFLEGNEQLDAILRIAKGYLQRIEINIEQNRMKAGLVKMFMGGIRRQFSEEQHGKYFLVTQGVTDLMREQMGMFNSQIGYVYLLDSECRVRWACCAEALPEEKRGMVRGIGRLSKEFKKQIEEKDPSLDLWNIGIASNDIRMSVDEVVSITGV